MRRPSLLYLDASAIVKLASVERESTALRDAIVRAGLASSELALAEVPRALARVRAGDALRARIRREGERVLSGFDFVPVTRPLLRVAGKLGPPRLRTLDALHVASALTFAGDLAAFVSYDRRRVEAADRAGLAVLSPGVGASR